MSSKPSGGGLRFRAVRIGGMMTRLRGLFVGFVVGSLVGKICRFRCLLRMESTVLLRQCRAVQR
jgi:hypothetical protein